MKPPARARKRDGLYWFGLRLLPLLILLLLVQVHSAYRARVLQRSRLGRAPLAAPPTPSPWPAAAAAASVEAGAVLTPAQAAAAALAAEDGLGAPNTVHYIFGMEAGFGHMGFGLMHLISVLATAMYVRPAGGIFWHGLYFPPANNTWWACASPLLRRVQEQDVLYVHGKAHPGLHVAHKADIVRMRIMREQGGIYLDSDIIPLASFEEVRRAGGRGRLTMGLEEAPGQRGLCNAVLVGAANTSFMNRWWAAYTSFDPQASWAYHSVILPRELAEAHPGEVTILSGQAFFKPVWTELKELYEADDGYDFFDNFAVHLWTSQEAKTYNGLRSLTVPGVLAGNGSFHRVARRVLRDAQAEGLLCPSLGYEAAAAASSRQLQQEPWRGKQYSRPAQRA